MSESFEEFFKLLEEDIHNSDELYDETCRYIKRKLGEWAVSKIIPGCNILYAGSSKQYRFVFDAIKEYLDDVAFQDTRIGLAEYLKEFWDIALATIGENGVKELLKKASEEK